jgi:tetratricopeptide (TPR) repeat protein
VRHPWIAVHGFTMRIAACAVLTFCASQIAMASGCEGAESALAAVSRDLGRNAADAAEHSLAPIEASHPDCAEILLDRARIHALRAENSQAENGFDRYTDLSPEDPNGYGYLALFLLDQEEYRRADTVSSLGLAKDANNPAVLAARGRILSMKGQSDQGRELLEKACQLDSENADAQYQIGLLYDQAKRKADAVPHFERAAALDPHDATAWDYLALDLEAIGNVDRLDEIYRKGLDGNAAGPHHDAFLDYNYGRFLMKRGDLENSKVHLDRAVAEVSQVRAVWYERARLNLRMKNYQQARTDAETATNTADPDAVIIDLQLYTLLEQIYRRLGETALADKYAELCRQTPPPVPKEYR